jgi:hypothetical protein
MSRYPWGDVPHSDPEQNVKVSFELNPEGMKAMTWLVNNLDLEEPAQVIEASLKLLGVCVVSAQKGDRILLVAEDGETRQLNFTIPSKEDLLSEDAE